MVNVVISSDPRYSINRGSIQAAALNVLSQNDVKSRVEIEVNIVGNRKMHELNKQYRGIDAPTDILSFALEDPNPQHVQNLPKIGSAGRQAGFVAFPDQILRLGSIIISYPHVVEDAALDGISVDDEISYLVEHGMNHLLGFHHD